MFLAWLMASVAVAQEEELPTVTWQNRLFVQPVGGLLLHSVDELDATAALLGVQAGLRLARVAPQMPQLQGLIRAQVQGALFSDEITYSDVRLGAFAAPRYTRVGLMIGPDLFWNELLADEGGLTGSWGLALPVVPQLMGERGSLYGGIQPAWLAQHDRRVDWDEADIPGFGHEMSYLVGGALPVGELSVSLGYSYKVVPEGRQQGVSLGMRL